MKILIVDDNRNDRKLLCSVVERHGHEAIEAVNGQEGLALAAVHCPDLIISDTMMPVMDGFQFLRSLKQDESLKSIPFIFYSAIYTEERDVQLGMALGAGAYIVKPSDPLELWQEVEAILKKGIGGSPPLAELIEEDETYLEQYCSVVAFKLEDKIREMDAILKEREILLKEIHHRVKNNLQIISSLLRLQASYVKDKQACEVFKDSQSRIRSMALIHEALYKSKNLAEIDFAEYVRTLAHELFIAYGAKPEHVSMNVKIKGVFLVIEKAVPCGLLINELVSNALRHAFPNGRQGEITVAFRIKDGRHTLVVADNGVGFPNGVDIRSTESLGLQMVNILARQLDGIINLKSNIGTAVTIRF
jgi:two-component sensor histidine kinase